jgi:uncharacterized protein YbaR (Trm112 family)
MLNQDILETLACPRCKATLETGDRLRCPDCRVDYPTVAGIPVLINDENSLFRVADFVAGRDSTYKTSTSISIRIGKRLVPSLNLSVKSKRNFSELVSRLERRGQNQRLLIVGGAVEGEGLNVDDLPQSITPVETDVAFGDRTAIICDAHDLPFRIGTFDGVIVQAVLEHVVDPVRCVSEIHRVLKADGLVYAETPFIAQVHLGKYDFQRFSHLAHRRLFRNFAEIESGATCGPGMALAWSYAYFLQSFFTSQTMRRIAFAAASWSGFWLKYFDYLLIDKPGTFDAALSYYFLGTASSDQLDDRELIKGYRGMIR